MSYSLNVTSALVWQNSIAPAEIVNLQERGRNDTVKQVIAVRNIVVSRFDRTCRGNSSQYPSSRPGFRQDLSGAG